MIFWSSVNSGLTSDNKEYLGLRFDLLFTRGTHPKSISGIWVIYKERLSAMQQTQPDFLVSSAPSQSLLWHFLKRVALSAQVFWCGHELLIPKNIHTVFFQRERWSFQTGWGGKRVGYKMLVYFNLCYSAQIDLRSNIVELKIHALLGRVISQSSSRTTWTGCRSDYCWFNEGAEPVTYPCCFTAETLGVILALLNENV